MDKELEETVLKVADYSNEEKIKLTKYMHWVFILGLIAVFTNFIMNIFEPANPSAVFDFFEGMSLGISTGIIFLGALATSKIGLKLKNAKLRFSERKGK